ncbi:MAG: GAF domain-containing protein, partial [Akkermansiaceae bacterium]|nr:GAF domain-containing protein [Akkermansiaceae bacterium]
MKAAPHTPDTTACDREVIHAPGSIQPHGILLALDPADLRVRQMSENAPDAVGLPGADLLDRPILDHFVPQYRDELGKLLAESDTPFSNPLRVPLLAGGTETVFDGIAHRTGDAIILELENRNDVNSADRPSSRSLDHHFQLTARSLMRVRGAASMAEAAAIVCEELRGFTAFDRVMLYRFAPDFHGEVIGEARRDNLEPFLGLHYPASDIPKQARELYKRNWIRLIYDVHAVPAGLVPPGEPLDLSQSVLRSVSPIHIEYLKNMGVRSSMSISLLDQDELCGLIACHHYEAPLFVPYSMRASCVHYGLVIAAQLTAKELQISHEDESPRHLSLNDLTKKLSGAKNFLEGLRSHARPLMDLVRASGIAIAHEDEVVTAGSTPATSFIRRLLDHLDDGPDTEYFATSSLPAELPQFDPPADTAAGVLAIDLGVDWRLLFFRPEDIETVRWGGDPNKAVDPDRPLTPRASFAEWKESVRGKSRPWSDADLHLAHELRASLMAFIVQQNFQFERLHRELAEKNREIEQFAYTVSHDLKSPLVTVNGYAGAMEEDLDAGDEAAARDALQRIQRAAKKMENLIEELLEFSRIGRHPGVMTPVDMARLMNELRADFALRCEEAGVDLEIDPLDVSITGYE